MVGTSKNHEGKLSYLNLSSPSELSSPSVLLPSRTPFDSFPFYLPNLLSGLSQQLSPSGHYNWYQIQSFLGTPPPQFHLAASPNPVCLSGDSIRSAANPSDSGVHAPPTDSQSTTATQIAD